MTIDRQRRKLVALAAASGAAAFMPRLAGAAEPLMVRIGNQKSSTLITVLKANGTLEKRLEPLGARISWHEFASGLPLLEALNVGSVDFSADVADTVPVPRCRHQAGLRRAGGAFAVGPGFGGQGRFGHPLGGRSQGQARGGGQGGRCLLQRGPVAEKGRYRGDLVETAGLSHG